MTSTLESINVNILQKIDCIINILVELINYEVDENEDSQITNYINSVQNLNQSYIQSTISIILEYHKLSISDDLIDNRTGDLARNQKNLYIKFIKAFKSINISNELLKIFNFCRRIEKKYKIKNQTILDNIKTYEYSVIEETYEDVKNDHCKTCNILYYIDEENSEFICKSCGMSEKMYGEVFEDEQFFYQEGSRTKHGKYDPTKHCKFWIDRIQAKEPNNIPEIIINKLKNCIRRDRIYADNITCEIIRGYLKELKISAFNDHVPLICRLITGIYPPSFTDQELTLIYMHFSNVIQIFNRIKPTKKSNCPYHPFFIYKIVEQILNKPYDQKRKKQILSCIHLQASETLIENDKTWFAIIEYIPEFSKITTCR